MAVISPEEHNESQTYLLHPSISHPSPKVVAAQGNYLILENGQRILDASGGPAVTSLGHGNRDVQRAVENQMQQFSYCHSLFWSNPAAEQLAKEVIQSTNGMMAKALFYNSGSEAMDATMKLARQYFLERSEPERVHFIARKGSFHGTTIGSMALTGKPQPRAHFEPLIPQNVSFVSACHPYRNQRDGETVEGYVHRLAEELDQEFQRVGEGRVCAFVAETVSGSSLGCTPAVPGYFTAIKAVCEKYGALLILDEVICGMGRTGVHHAWQQDHVVPDIQAIAKGLGGGYVPISGVLIHEKVVSTLAKGSGFFNHGHTYQSHAVACAAALEVQRIIKRENLLQNVVHMGARLEKGLKASLQHHPNVGDIRGRGLFWCIEFVKDKVTKEPFPSEGRVATKIRQRGLRHAISLHPGSGSVDGYVGDHVLVSPAYNVTKEEIDVIVERIAAVVTGFFAEL